MNSGAPIRLPNALIRLFEMKTLLSAALAILLLTFTATGANRDALWKAVDVAEKKMLPRTAIEKLRVISAQAVAEKAWPEAVRAIARRIFFEARMETKGREMKVRMMEAEMKTAAPEMQPMLELILANWYWDYYRDRDRGLENRSLVTHPPEANNSDGARDFTTWDSARILKEVETHFEKALTSGELLGKIPITDFNGLLRKGTVPDAWRPTLFDFVAHSAVAFCVSGNFYLDKDGDEPALSADGPIFAPRDEFLRWEFKGTDPNAKAVQMLQRLMRFHAGDSDRSAFLHCDLERLRFGINFAVGEKTLDRYREALKRFCEAEAAHEISASARTMWAKSVLEESPAEAREIAKAGFAAFPKSIGGRECRDIVTEVEAPDIQTDTERVWNAPWPVIHVEHRNTPAIYFRLIPLEWSRDMHVGNDEFFLRRMLATKPARTWKADLPATPDFKSRDTDIPVPQDVKPGFYRLLTSLKQDFSAKDAHVGGDNIWVSNIALLTRGGPGTRSVSGLVLDARSGNPIKGATVQFWRTDKLQKEPVKSSTTDADGKFSFSELPNGSGSILAMHGEHGVASASGGVNEGNSEESAGQETIFFTDRSLYRPGQTIQFKGICLSSDKQTNDYKVLGGQDVEVALVDANQREIAKSAHRTNDYGSFSGRFPAPQTGLTGEMNIIVRAGPSGHTTVRVEEYKRPKFRIELAAPHDSPKLGDRVTITGKAVAFSGAAMSGCSVKWRVSRWSGYGFSGGKQIARDLAETKPDGSFSVEFKADPDLAFLGGADTVFTFEIEVDVTDTTGETRSESRSIKIGSSGLTAEISAADWLPAGIPVKLEIETKTHSEDGRAAEGKIRIFKLKQPEAVERPRVKPRYQSDADILPSWDAEEQPVTEMPFATDVSGKGSVAIALDAGPYRAVVETKDASGKPVTTHTSLNVLNMDGKPLAARIPDILVAPKWEAEPGEEFTAFWASGYKDARAFVEIEHRGKTIQAYWTEPDLPQHQVKLAVTEAMRGGFTLFVTMVYENRASTWKRFVDVPWSNKKLAVKWERFTSKLETAAKTTWTAVITGPDAKMAAAEMVATLCDRSLDEFLPHRWKSAFDVFHYDSVSYDLALANDSAEGLRVYFQRDYSANAPTTVTFRDFRDRLIEDDWRQQYFAPRSLAEGADVFEAPQIPQNFGAAPGIGLGSFPMTPTTPEPAAGFDDSTVKSKRTPDLSKVSARKNLAETAFFFPHLITRDDGSVAMEFTTPEALTTWRFMGFAHDGNLRSGFIEDTAVTSRELMVQPNPPRFLREGDALEFTVKVANQSPTRQTGKVRLTFADAATDKSADERLANTMPEQDFDLPANESRSFSWKLKVPDGAEPLKFKALAATDRMSDGEEGLLPVLSRRTLVTESLPMSLRGAQTKTFDFTRLAESAKSGTIQSQSLTVQMVSNPAWYAVMALPYLIEFPHECSEQTFNRYYANVLAEHIANSDPKIRAVFDQWKATPALASPLEKNAELAAITLEETPWLRDANAQGKSRRNVGILFDENRLAAEKTRVFEKLAETQNADGAWSWFPGGPPSDAITLYIMTGLGRLRRMGIEPDPAPAEKGLKRLDGWIEKLHREILKNGKSKENHLTTEIAAYLYARSFFVNGNPIPPESRRAVNYFLAQAREHWPKLGNRQSQAHAAIALHRLGDKAAAAEIVKSLRERATTNEEMGMFWREAEQPWSWWRAPIETHAMMIEVFDEVAGDARAVEDAKAWLLKQKQTQDWKTTKATADAIYALLRRGTNILASDAVVETKLGDMVLKPGKLEAGTGFYEHKFVRAEVKPELARITLTKTDAGISWGSAHWHYLEDIADVTAADSGALIVEKQLFARQDSPKGQVLVPVNGRVKVGDELVVRIILRVDRDMEYVHLKDHRGSGTEPVNVLSGYRWQGRLGFYETTRDAATHWYFDRLPKGEHVLESSVRVVHRGRYQAGFATIQCMYAPEFSAHSGSAWVEAE